MMNRRTMLAALPTSTFALGAAASSTPTDPILTHYREWLDARAECMRLIYAAGNGSLDLPEIKAAEAREDVALDAMVELTPKTKEGMAALLHVVWYFEVQEAERQLPEYADQVEDPMHKAILGLWRATTGTPMPLGT
jgi:hypothetical protein